MKDTVCELYAKSVWGQCRLYPDNLVANSFCNLADKKTLDVHDLREIRNLGFEVRILGDLRGLSDFEKKVLGSLCGGNGIVSEGD